MLSERPAEFWRLWEAYATQALQCRNQGAWIRAHMVNVGKLWLESFGSKPDVPVTFFTAPKKARPQPALVWDDPFHLVLQKSTFTKFFGLGLAAAGHSWTSRIRDPSVPLRWVSYLQLYISFQRREGPWYIAKKGGKWETEKSTLARLANHSSLNVRVKHFRLMFQQYLRDSHVKFSSGTVRPFSSWISCFRGSIGFHLAQTEFDEVEHVLATCLDKPATGDGSALRNLRGV